MKIPFVYFFVAILLACMLVNPEVKAVTTTYSTVLTIDYAGNSFDGEINPSSISLGDSYTILFSLNGDAPEIFDGGDYAEFGANAFTLVSMTRNDSNTGTFTPNYSAQDLTLLVQNISDESYFQIDGNVASAETVDFTREGEPAVALFFRMNINFDTNAAYDNGGIGTPLGNFMNTPPDTWTSELSTASFAFQAENVNSLVAYGSLSEFTVVSVIPEPSTWGLLAIGAAMLAFWSRRQSMAQDAVK